MFSNHIGCDGERVYYDGCSMVAVNGDIVSQGEQFSLKEVVSQRIGRPVGGGGGSPTKLVVTERGCTTMMVVLWLLSMEILCHRENSSHSKKL